MPHSILIVDDDESLRSLLDMILNRAGYTTYQAANGLEALEFIEMEMPDLFVVDVMMPGMSGIELTQALRAAPKTAQHPIIMVSARTDKDSVNAGLSSGANLYLSKPVSSKELIPRIEELLSAVAGSN